MQSFKFLILSAFLSAVFGCECDIISEQVCSLSKFSYLDSLIITQMINVTDFSAHSYWMYLNKFDKKMYETVVQPAFCSKVLGLPSYAICNLNEYIITEAIQMHVDNENYNVFISLIVNIGIRMSRNGFTGSIINVFDDIKNNTMGSFVYSYEIDPKGKVQMTEQCPSVHVLGTTIDNVNHRLVIYNEPFHGSYAEFIFSGAQRGFWIGESRVPGQSISDYVDKLVASFEAGDYNSLILPALDVIG